MRSLIRLALPILVLASCGPWGRGRQPGTDQDVIHAEELEGTRQNSLYEAVRVARPMWFVRDRNRSGESIIVYQDDRPIGGVAILRQISVFSVASVRYMSPTEAQIRFGQRNGLRPAILVETFR